MPGWAENNATPYATAATDGIRHITDSVRLDFFENRGARPHGDAPERFEFRDPRDPRNGKLSFRGTIVAIEDSHVTVRRESGEMLTIPAACRKVE